MSWFLTKPTLSDRIQLSLDGQLDAKEQARLRSDMGDDAIGQHVEAEYLAIKQLLGALPKRPVPRNFTLTPQMAGVKPPIPVSLFTFQRVTSGLVVAFMAIAMSLYLFSDQLIGQINQPMASSVAVQAEPMALSVEAPAASEAMPNDSAVPQLFSAESTAPHAETLSDANGAPAAVPPAAMKSIPMPEEAPANLVRTPNPIELAILVVGIALVLLIIFVNLAEYLNARNWHKQG